MFDSNVKFNATTGRHYFFSGAAGHIDADVEQAELSGCCTFPSSWSCLLIDSMARDGEEGIWQSVCCKHR